jgi:hypothetical protein
MSTDTAKLVAEARKFGSHIELVGRLCSALEAAQKDSARLELILRIIHEHGTRGLSRFIEWGIGCPIDRSAIDAAMAQSSTTGGQP